MRLHTEYNNGLVGIKSWRMPIDRRRVAYTVYRLLFFFIWRYKGGGGGGRRRAAVLYPVNKTWKESRARQKLGRRRVEGKTPKWILL
jgi:hypothetical protein